MSARCDIHECCEGSPLHIRGRCAGGCAQFQDGSWLNKNVCHEPHPGLPKGTGEAERTRAWLLAELEWAFRR